MINKVLLGLLIFLVVISAGTGAYSYILKQEVDELSQQLLTFQEEQEDRLGTFQDSIAEQGSHITSVNDEVEDLRSETGTQLDNLGQEIDGALTSIGKIKENIADITGELSRSITNAGEVYRIVNQATVGITDGDVLVGSGFMYTGTHVLTAYHVVENISDIYITFPDGSISAAVVVGISKYSDIAVLALDDIPDIEPLVLADSSEVKVGDPVFTVGSPFNLTESLTSGIVSHTNRFVNIEYGSQTRAVANIIQFDAPANYGNSGCPLLNSRGEVIGLVTARIKPEEGDGINYAVSSNKVKRVAAAIREQGYFSYPWFGINITDITPKAAENRGLETVHGALVVSVLADGPAWTAGIQINDIIAAVDGISIRSVAGLTAYLGEYKSPGDMSTVTILRDGEEIELGIQVGKAP